MRVISKDLYSVVQSKINQLFLVKIPQLNKTSQQLMPVYSETKPKMRIYLFNQVFIHRVFSQMQNQWSILSKNHLLLPRKLRNLQSKLLRLNLLRSQKKLLRPVVVVFLVIHQLQVVYLVVLKLIKLQHLILQVYLVQLINKMRHQVQFSASQQLEVVFLAVHLQQEHFSETLIKEAFLATLQQVKILSPQDLDQKLSNHIPSRSLKTRIMTTKMMVQVRVEIAHLPMPLRMSKPHLISKKKML